MLKKFWEAWEGIRKYIPIAPDFSQRFGEMTHSISSEEEYVADNPGQVPREVVCTAFDENNAVMCSLDSLDSIRFISEIWSLC